jgi:homoaconitase/3-isopropylmalate dehydratase large subunit
MSNMGVEMDSKGAIFPVDGRTIEYLKKVGANGPYDSTWADDDAVYFSEHEYDMGEVVPGIAAPHRVDNYRTVEEVKGLRVDQCFIGTCTNGRYEDLRIAADILGGERVAKDIRLIVGPASRTVLEEALRDGTIGKLVEARRYGLKKLYITDTIPQKDELLDHDFIERHSLSKLFALVINRMHYDQSVSTLVKVDNR